MALVKVKWPSEQGWALAEEEKVGTLYELYEELPLGSEIKSEAAADKKLGSKPKTSVLQVESPALSR